VVLGEHPDRLGQGTEEFHAGDLLTPPHRLHGEDGQGRPAVLRVGAEVPGTEDFQGPWEVRTGEEGAEALVLPDLRRRPELLHLGRGERREPPHQLGHDRPGGIGHVVLVGPELVRRDGRVGAEELEGPERAVGEVGTGMAPL